MHRSSYIKKLKWLSEKFFVFCDVRDQRALLVDGATALLHLVMASLENNFYDGTKDTSLFEPDQLEAAAFAFSSRTEAIRVLTNLSTRDFKLFERPNRADKEMTTASSNQEERSHKRNKSYVRFEDKVEDIHHVLEQILDIKGFHPPTTPERPRRVRLHRYSPSRFRNLKSCHPSQDRRTMLARVCASPRCGDFVRLRLQ